MTVQQILGRLDELARRAEQEDEERRLLRKQQRSEIDQLRRQYRQQGKELLKLRQRCEERDHSIQQLTDLILEISRSPTLRDHAQKVQQSLDA